MVAVPEALKLIFESRDFPSPSAILKGVSAQDAVSIPVGCPYSIATQVFHTWFWQDRWLKQIDGVHTPPFAQDDSDFPVVHPAEWDGVRERLLADFERMKELSSHPGIFDRPTQFGDTVEVLILRNTLHISYHLGQIALIRRLLGWILE